MEQRLYHHERLGAVECLGCRELIEIPHCAVLRAGQRPERVRGNPENLLLWLELQELDHEKCLSFNDAEKALAARQHRFSLGSQRRTSRSGSASGSGGMRRG